jgi:hypothetical protein
MPAHLRARTTRRFTNGDDACQVRELVTGAAGRPSPVAASERGRWGVLAKYPAFLYGTRPKPARRRGAKAGPCNLAPAGNSGQMWLPIESRAALSDAALSDLHRLPGARPLHRPETEGAEDSLDTG